MLVQPAVTTLSRLFELFPELPRKALTIKQPWCHFILEGKKDVENRSWLTHYRGPVLIHAAAKPRDIYLEDEEEIGAALGYPYPKELSTREAPLGGIVGVVDIVDCVERHSSPWYIPGNFAFELRNPRRLPFVPLKGKLGFFKV